MDKEKILEIDLCCGAMAGYIKRGGKLSFVGHDIPQINKREKRKIRIFNSMEFEYCPFCGEKLSKKILTEGSKKRA